MRPIIGYVDDDITNHGFYKEILGDNYEVQTFARSLDLVNCLDNKHFDCFIFDIYMPLMDGFQLLERVRRHPDNKKTPVFFVTTNPHDEVKVSSFKKGAADFFDRLITKNELLARLESRISFQKEFSAIHKLGSLQLDQHAIEVKLHKKDITLTLIEFKLLSRLLQSFPKKILKTDLINYVWGNQTTHSNNLNSHIYNLRLKLEGWEYEIRFHKNEGLWLVPVSP